jgi:predicted enzyme related to lactoylglutathione lyase
VITALHALLYSRDVDSARAFFKDVLKFKSVDAGDGWLIFAAPPTELAVHPTQKQHGPELYFMCDDITTTVADLEIKGAKATQSIIDQGWGLVTSLRIPGGIEVGLYEPRHKTAVSIKKRRGTRASRVRLR